MQNNVLEVILFLHVSELYSYFTDSLEWFTTKDPTTKSWIEQKGAFLWQVFPEWGFNPEGFPLSLSLQTQAV